MACRGCGCGCGPGHLNEDTARFLLLAALLVLYLLGGAAVFSALERAHERQARQRWEERLAGFGRRHHLSRDELRGFLRHFEEAAEAGVRVDGARPRWDFPGAFYFVGTVVSTIGTWGAGAGARGSGALAGPAGGRLGVSRSAPHPQPERTRERVVNAASRPLPWPPARDRARRPRAPSVGAALPRERLSPPGSLA